MSFLQGKVALITGGGRAVLSDGKSGSIGYGIATAYAKEGANLVITGRNKAKLDGAKQELEDKYGIKVLALQADINPKADNQAVAKGVVDQAVKEFGRLDVLINNAQAAYPHLKETAGSVINFASGAGLFGNYGQCAYAAAKEGIRGMSRVAATEWAKDNINVNVVCPLAWTAKLEQFKEAFPDAFKANVHVPPMGHFGDAEKEIGRVCVQLASPDFKYMTGETLTLEGGLGQRP